MRQSILFPAFALATVQFVLGQTLNNVPACAQTCLSNATTVPGNPCSSLDVKCLCNNENYVNSLSCCLATLCSGPDQQKATSFNIATCASVNETAPNFVGCSPLGVTSGSNIVFGTSSTISSPISSATTASMSMSTPIDSLVVTVTGNVESQLTSFLGSQPVTATYTGHSLLTGSCTKPFFAMVTDSMGMMTQFPEIGCSHDQEGCCPFDSHQNAVLMKCPEDYTTTAGACCPSGWQIYFSDLGGQTPCYTMPSTTLVPAMTPAVTGITVITEHVFTRKFSLAAVAEKGKSKGLSAGAEAGIAIGAFFGLCLLAGLIFFVFRRRNTKKAAARHVAVEPASGEEKPLGSPVAGAHELASPHSQPNSPESGRSAWRVGVLPPAYNYQGELPRSRSNKTLGPQELPGSMFINEHHPAFAGQDELEFEQPVTAPSSPPRSPAQRPASAASPVVSPLGSPKHG